MPDQGNELVRAREICEIMRENNVVMADVFANFHNTAHIDVIAYLSPGHDALLMSDIKSGTRCHVQLEFNLMPEHESSHLSLSSSFSTSLSCVSNLTVLTSLKQLLIITLRRANEKEKKRKTSRPRSYTAKYHRAIIFHFFNEIVASKSSRSSYRLPTQNFSRRS